MIIQSTIKLLRSNMQLPFDMSRFSIEEPEAEYEHYVNLTAKLIKRPYFVTHKLVEQWPMDTIKRLYLLATKHHGSIEPHVKWWAERKKLINR